jgi:hypothetical protein
MKKLLYLVLAAIIFSACATAPAEKEIAVGEVVDPEAVEEPEESENIGKIAAENNYYILPDTATVEALDSTEYKMLINLADYSPELLWELMKEAAAETGVTIHEEDEPMKRKYREVQYIDNEFGMMSNFGYVLRYRQKFEDFVALGSSDNVHDSKYDVTIKFRDSDLQKSLSIPLSVGEKFADIEKGPEMEADISPFGIKYSWAIKVKPKVKDWGEFSDLFDSSIESYSELYPALLDIGLPADTVINPVGGLTILEEKVEPAIMVLSCGAEMEVAFSKFFMDGVELVSEASFDFDTEYEVKDADGNEVEKKMTLEDFKQTEAFYKAILVRYNERLNFGWSKTKFVYDTLFPDATVE